MPKLTLNTNPIALKTLLEQCQSGQLQLPDFQRSWVWEEDRIKSLISSVSQGFPVGALMTLKAKMDGSTSFAHRGIQGTLIAKDAKPHELLLDGQQRMTSLYQTCLQQQVVSTITAKKRLVDRWFYIDIMKALEPEADRDAAIVAVPADRRLKENFDRDVVLDLSTPEKEYEHFMFPLNRVFDPMNWSFGFVGYWSAKGYQKLELVQRFNKEVLDNISSYQVPVISLGADTSREAVCIVFEKVNTGGKALDAFELLTAMYAADGHKLRNDWLGISKPTDSKDDEGEPFDWLGTDGTNKESLRRGIQLHFIQCHRAGSQTQGVLANVAATDFLQAIALLHTKEMRVTAEREQPTMENTWPAVRATRQSLLDLPLAAYKKYCGKVVYGFECAARFLVEQHIYRVVDIPYQTQLVPLAAIFAEMGVSANHATVRAKIERWYWCGVFGELYGSSAESRFAKDIIEVPKWLRNTNTVAPLPTSVNEGVLRPDRLLTMRSRLSAAYKGIHALLMRKHAKDFRSGQEYAHMVFFDSSVDIHHIFPKAWCEKPGQKIAASVYDSVINKTPLTDRSNRIIGGDAPSKYLSKLETGKPGEDGYPALERTVLIEHLKSHAIPVDELYADDFYAFMAKRQAMLMELITSVTLNAALVVPNAAQLPDDEGKEVPSDVAREAGMIGAGID